MLLFLPELPVVRDGLGVFVCWVRDLVTGLE